MASCSWLTDPLLLFLTIYESMSTAGNISYLHLSGVRFAEASELRDEQYDCDV
jgi:hypothetical protein